jgi:CO/xanthine dehydrogenase FAD-binding subunit
VAAIVQPDNAGRVAEARIAVGSCSAVARRLTKLEHDLIGRPTAAGITSAVRPDHLSPLSPIDDIRATAEYRRDASLTLIRRALEACVGRL